MTQNYDAAVSAHKEAVDAFTQFHTALIGGVQEINNHVFALAQNAIELNLETGKAVAGVKSPQQLAELQSRWVRQFFRTALSGTAKLSEISTKIASDVAEPVQSHICNTVGRIADKVTSLASNAA